MSSTRDNEVVEDTSIITNPVNPMQNNQEITELNDLITEIARWDQLIATNNDLVDIGFFKIYIKFEKLLLETIVNYAIGNLSSIGYEVNRRLEFDDYEHFKKTVSNKSYLDFSNRMEEIVQQIFTDDNPYSQMFNSVDNNYLNKMKVIRNYIAHESEESKMKYQRVVLPNGAPFVAPHVYLQQSKNRTDAQTNYTFYIEVILKYAKYVCGE